MRRDHWIVWRLVLFEAHVPEQVLWKARKFCHFTANSPSLGRFRNPLHYLVCDA